MLSSRSSSTLSKLAMQKQKWCRNIDLVEGERTEQKTDIKAFNSEWKKLNNSGWKKVKWKRWKQLFDTRTSAEGRWTVTSRSSLLTRAFDSQKTYRFVSHRRGICQMWIFPFFVNFTWIKTRQSRHLWQVVHLFLACIYLTKRNRKKHPGWSLISHVLMLAFIHSIKIKCHV